MKTEAEIEAERKLLQTRRRRKTVLMLVRGGHERQLSRMDDFEVWKIMLGIGQTVGRDQVVTMLQDLQILGYVNFKSAHNEYSGRVELSEIELTASGLRFMIAGHSNEDVEML